MNEEQLIQFVNWLPSVVPEFKNSSPEEIVQSLNQMAESEDGQQRLSQLFTAFQESQTSENSQLFKKGGKLDAFLNKYKKGGKCCKKKKETIQGGMVNKVAEKMKTGGELSTNISANTLSNFGLMPKAQRGIELPQYGNNPAENTVLDILGSIRPFVQQNVTPFVTREYYASSRPELPDKVGGIDNFEGAIRTIIPGDTTIVYQIPGQGRYGVASSSNKGNNWRYINSQMDKTKAKVNTKK